MSFLNAEWRKLALINYEIDEELLKDYLPFKTELDKWNDTTYISLVGFMFQNTRMLGFKIPFHVNFEEVNLRFYVRYKDGTTWKRGVVFIKEIVPKSALTFVANTLYGEHYETKKMKHLWQLKDQSRITRYEWKCKNKWQTIHIESSKETFPIAENSEAEFITEHYWGYTKRNEKTTFEYEVTHPKWEAYNIHDFDVEVDYGMVYGDRFSILNGQKPLSVMLAEGSEITVEGKRRI
ncbi:MAG: DUF2071 domain-containing protein [Saprospiraceae bacterium]|nr:DUF2071 domain-containing protein [Saprospiraceae bacterium]